MPEATEIIKGTFSSSTALSDGNSSLHPPLGDYRGREVGRGLC